MLSYRIGNTYDFWVTNTTEIWRILEAMKIFAEEMNRIGYTETNVFVGDGVHELDTGYESFGAVYGSFGETAEKLCADFAKAREELDGMWLHTLNFESICVEYGTGIRKAVLEYSRGVITVRCGLHENRVNRACREKIKPYLYEQT